MSDQPQKYQNIREFLDNLPVVPCAWQPDNPNICNTCLRINDSVARICSVWAQAHEDAPLEEMEFDEEISLAVSEHYLPSGIDSKVPKKPYSIALSLSDKIPTCKSAKNSFFSFSVISLLSFMVTSTIPINI